MLLARNVAFSNNEALVYDTLIRPVVYLIPLKGLFPAAAKLGGISVCLPPQSPNPNELFYECDNPYTKQEMYITNEELV